MGHCYYSASGNWEISSSFLGINWESVWNPVIPNTVWDNIDKYMNYGDYFQRKEILHLLGHKFYNLFLRSVSLQTSG